MEGSSVYQCLAHGYLTVNGTLLRIAEVFESWHNRVHTSHFIASLGILKLWSEHVLSLVKDSYLTSGNLGAWRLAYSVTQVVFRYRATRCTNHYDRFPTSQLEVVFKRVLCTCTKILVIKTIDLGNIVLLVVRQVV